MTINEAIKILDPETSKEALLPYAYDNHQRRKVVDEACRVAADELSKRQWISVKDRLPEKDAENVLVVVNGQYKAITFTNAIQIAMYDDETKDWIVDEFPEWEKPNVTHWQPLPDLPSDSLQSPEPLQIEPCSI